MDTNGTDTTTNPQYDRYIYIAICIGLILFITLLFLCAPYDPYFQLSSASATLINSSSAMWNLLLKLTNPNHIQNVFYDTFYVSVFYGDSNFQPITMTKLPPLVLPKHNRTVLHVYLSIPMKSLGNELMKKFVEDQERGWVGFWFSVSVTMRMEQGDGRRLMRANCYDPIIMFESDKSLGLSSNLPKDCVLEIEESA